MKKWKSLVMASMLLATVSSANAAFGQSQQPRTNSVQNSPKLDTDANKEVESSELRVQREKNQLRSGEDRTAKLINACAAAVEELAESKKLIALLDSENALLKKRLDSEIQKTAVLEQLNETRKSESDALRLASAAKDEVIAAKNAVITGQDKLIDALKHKRTPIWKRLGDILLGAAVFAVLK